MTRLIDAVALQKALAQMWFDSPLSVTGMSVSVLIDEQPTIEAEPVRHGKWMTHRTRIHDGEWYCSVCDYEPTVFEGTKYCPNCGAKMEVEK